MPRINASERLKQFEKFYKDFGYNLASIRVEKGISQHSVDAALGHGRGLLSNRERGLDAIRLHEIGVYAAALGVEPWELLQYAYPLPVVAVGDVVVDSTDKADGAEKGTDHVIGYMCGVDWQHEIGYASDGNRIFPSAEDCADAFKCTAQCGIVEVKVQFSRWVMKGEL